MKKKASTVAVMRLAVSGLRLKLLQAQNDLDATRRRFDMLEEANENLRRNHSEQSVAFITACRDRDDWRDAFKLIMKLVK